MKKLLAVASFLLILLLPSSARMQTAGASLFLVKVPQDFPTIQAAIDVVQSGGTVLVSAGTYYENILINKPLRLIGENKSITIIEGARNGTIEVVRTENVTIKDFTIINNVSASSVFPIRLSFSNNNRVEDCSLDAVSLYSGVWLEYSYNNVIRNNNITNSGKYGVYLFESDNNTIADNIVASQNGILFSTWCEFNTIAGNTIVTHNKSALYLYTCSNNTFYHNSFINMTNPVFGWNFVNFWDNGFLEGNYWSSYGDSFNPTTGIGLTPYIIDDYNKDNYPLMNPYIAGDFNHDGWVNWTDASLVVQAWQSRKGESNYNPHVDFSMDRIINIKDATIIGINWQKTALPKTGYFSRKP